MAETYKAGQGGHLEAHNKMSQFIEDAENGDIPALIGPEGPQGPVGPEGPKGDDGVTPKAFHQNWDRTLIAGETDFLFSTDPDADTGNGFDPGNVSVHLNGIRLVQTSDYSVRLEPDQDEENPPNLVVTLFEPAEQDDVLHVGILFAFGVAEVRAEGITDYMVDFGGVEGAEVLQTDSEEYRTLHGDRLFVVMSD